MSKLKQLLFSLNETDRKIIEKKLKEKDQQINQLKQQLDEKDKEIESLHETISNKVTSAYGADLMAKSIQFFLEKENHELKQHQTQLAIQELEKVKENLKQLEINIDNQAGFSQGYKLELKQKSLYKNVYKTIDQQINALKGEKDVKD